MKWSRTFSLRGRHGFTLIELLVVIAIIGLLLGALLPTLSRARGAARGVACLSRMRDLALATDAYVGANRESFPRSQHSAGAWRQLPWEQAHYEYFTGGEYDAQSGDPWWDDASWWACCRDRYQCPFDRRENPARRDGLPFPVPSLSYGQNVYMELRGDEIDPIGWAGRKAAPYQRLAQIPRPSATVLFGEIKESSLTDHLMAHFWTLMHATPDQDTKRHGSRAGVVYIDGNARECALADNYDPANGVDRWNPARAH